MAPSHVSTFRGIPCKLPNPKLQAVVAKMVIKDNKTRVLPPTNTCGFSDTGLQIKAIILTQSKMRQTYRGQVSSELR